LLYLTGTVPIFYEGASYNIPVDIFIPEAYPAQAPQTYVRPKGNLELSKGHENVDMEGLVYMPYLHEWSHGSNLQELITLLSSIFSAKPPLFAAPIIQPVAPSNSSYASQRSTSSTFPAQENATNRNYASNVGNGRVTSSADMNDQMRIGGGGEVQKLVSARARLEDQVTIKLQEGLQNYYRRLTDELKAEEKTERALRESEDTIKRNLAFLKKKQQDLIRALAEVEQKSLELTAWSSEMATNSAVDVESRLEPYDDLSAQVVHLSASQHAIADTLWRLDYAFANKTEAQTISLDRFLAQARKLNREQFRDTAHLKKIRDSLSQHGI